MSEDLQPDLEPLLRADLPRLPDELVEGDVVPVARWVGTRLAAIRTVTHDGSAALSDDVSLFRRGEASDDWDEFSGCGGSEWYTTADGWSRLEPLPGTAVQWDGLLVVADGSLSAATIGGRAGSEAVAVALTQQTRVVEAITSPLGLFVVAFDPSRAWKVEVLSRDAAVLADRSGPV